MSSPGTLASSRSPNTCRSGPEIRRPVQDFPSSKLGLVPAPLRPSKGGVGVPTRGAGSLPDKASMHNQYIRFPPPPPPPPPPSSSPSVTRLSHPSPPPFPLCPSPSILSRFTSSLLTSSPSSSISSLVLSSPSPVPPYQPFYTGLGSLGHNSFSGCILKETAPELRNSRVQRQFHRLIQALIHVTGIGNVSGSELLCG
ncbi:unnamed protein product [Pleuronectes platessa]|uniref:Uncharacterized protein n=1 Tax=Pleuronectes platessa TaxID=8262 RepID=A0A9N7VH28_PLEPL|nr:unnamed protein product [Pleuronectes platessa]